MKTDDDLMFTKYEPPPVVLGPWPADGHPFWERLKVDYEDIRKRARVLAARYAPAYAEQPWADRIRRSWKP